MFETPLTPPTPSSVYPRGEEMIPAERPARVDLCDVLPLEEENRQPSQSQCPGRQDHQR